MAACTQTTPGPCLATVLAFPPLSHNVAFKINANLVAAQSLSCPLSLCFDVQARSLPRDAAFFHKPCTAILIFWGNLKLSAASASHELQCAPRPLPLSVPTCHVLQSLFLCSLLLSTLRPLLLRRPRVPIENPLSALPLLPSWVTSSPLPKMKLSIAFLLLRCQQHCVTHRSQSTCKVLHLHVPLPALPVQTEPAHLPRIRDANIDNRHNGLKAARHSCPMFL